MALPVLYKNPIPFNAEVVGLRQLKSRGDYFFARDAHQVPAYAHEFSIGCMHYPIVFVYDGDGVVMPLFLLGFREGENRFVDHAGQWLVDYVPAYVRRYPFVLEENGRDDPSVWI
ncbi:MAG: SapC family protein, partial [Magnetococcales bacterium]|nr:SapC family protein [Magnetococcales bacterium]